MRSLTGSASTYDVSAAVANLTQSTGVSYRSAFPVAIDNSGMTVNFSGKASWLYQTYNATQNWAGTDLIIVTLRNEESFPTTYGLCFSSSTDPSNLNQAFNAPITLAAKETRRFALVLNTVDPTSAGIRALPAPSGDPVTYVGSSTKLDPSKVGHWRFSYQGTAPAKLTVKEIDRMAYVQGFPGLADAFGQFAGRTWTNKIGAASDFALRKADEVSDLAANSPASTLYGNSALGNLGTSDRWRVATVNGKKYFATPSGLPFWMTGLVGVNDWNATMIQNRTGMFSSLPAQTDDNADLFQYHNPVRGTAGTMFMMQRANLRQKYGRNYSPEFVSTLKKRLPSWGFNTVGVGAMDAMYDNSAPFTMQLSTSNFPVRLNTPQISWQPLPDPYDATFQTFAAAQFALTLNTKKTSSNLVGAFVDNELSWGMTNASYANGDLSIGIGALNAGAAQPARKALVSMLTAKYGIVSKLNAAWGTNFANFNALNSSVLNATAKNDLKLFVSAFANTYFSKVKAALSSIGFKGLYLGCRFNDCNNDVLNAAAQYVDVLSFNMYRQSGDMNWAQLNSLPKPVLISEFGFGHNEGSGFAGQPLASSTTERASWTNAYLRAAAAQPNVIGVQYYAYNEDPVTGVADNEENYAYGIVDVTDNPDAKMTAVFRQFAKDLFTIRR